MGAIHTVFKGSKFIWNRVVALGSGQGPEGTQGAPGVGDVSSSSGRRLHGRLSLRTLTELAFRVSALFCMDAMF